MDVMVEQLSSNQNIYNNSATKLFYIQIRWFRTLIQLVGVNQI
jgi:hypothetical protein